MEQNHLKILSSQTCGPDAYGKTACPAA